jgi:hypothetical protein
VDQEILHPAQAVPVVATVEPISQFSELLSATIDRLSSVLFCVSFSGLTHLITSWWCRFFAQG